MSSSAFRGKTLTLDSTALYITAHTTVFSQQPSFPVPLPPVPSSFPIQKLIPRTRFIIDGFKHAGDFSVSYFLSHFHSDHYCGLSPSWSRGVIYCSCITARLLIEVLKVPAPFVVPLPLCESIIIDGCEVYLIDANHCPGAVQFLFKVAVNKDKVEKYVHTGDFRYCNSMKSLSLLNEFIGPDAVFLDTTYCNPKYIFPSQEESIDYVVGVIEKIGAENDGGMKNVLFLVATYVIGKEKILLEISRRCKRKIHVDDRKMTVLSVLGMGEDGVFTENERESDVHVVGWNVLGETWPYFRPNFVRMKEIMQEKGYSRAVGFVPTGWTYEVKKNKFAVRMKDSFEIHLVPYSEHSNYEELREYVKFLKPKRVTPTVGVDIEKADSKEANAILKHFAALLDVTAVKQEFLMSFHRGARESEEKDDSDSALASSVTSKQQNEGLLSANECSKDMNMQEDMNYSLPCQEPASAEMETLNQDNLEESIQELRDCLPCWVAQSQMLDLLRSSGNNVIEAVSMFYEHETEFYEQINADISCISKSAASSQFESASPSEIAPDASALCSKLTQLEPGLPSTPFPVKSLLIPENVSLSQKFKLPSMTKSIKSRVSSGKRKKTPENKTNKKSKSNKSQESIGSKQYTITKFFNKLTPLVSKADEAACVSTQSQEDNILVQNDITENQKDAVDQFIQIVNGDESLRRQAVTILENAKGDINVALDIYYSNYSCTINEKKERLPDCKLVQTESAKQSNSSDEVTNIVQTKVFETGMPSPVQPRDHASTDYISLPPERYSPAEHACWTKGQPAPYLHLARTFELVEEERGRIKATSMICNMFRSLLVLSPEDVLPAVYLCVNKIAPDHENMELNIGGSTVIAALEDACGTNKSKIRDLYNSLGDLGDVAQLCRQTQSLLAPPAVLTVKGVYCCLRKIR